MDLSYDGNGLLVGYTQNDTYSDWAGAQFTNTTTKEIVRDGDKIIYEKITEYNQLENTTSVKNVKYTYDEKGASGMTVNNVSYYFVRNIFGDVTAIYDESRNKKAEYSYDAWGTCYMPVNVDGIGSLNPFRYRGYYFVPQIGLYYLTTRFYDYMTGRFVNADVPSICIDDGLTVPEGCNLYSYCRNNPISYVDPTGHFALIIGILLMTTAIGGVIGGVVSYENGKSGWDLVSDIFLGAMIGLALGGFIIAAGAAAYGGLTAIKATFLGVKASQAFAVGALAVDFVAFGVAPLYGIVMQSIDMEPSKNPVQKPQPTPPHPYGKVDILNDFYNNIGII